MIIQDGSAVGLVSGGWREATTDLYLPLDLPNQVLQALRSGKSIPRGSIQSIWELQKPAECHARGMSYEEIEKYSPDSRGLLVATQVLPKGPSHNRIEEADILLTVDGQNVTSLDKCERLLDDAIGKTLRVEVYRSGRLLNYEIGVECLGKLNPSRLLEFAGGFFHALGYHTAVECHTSIEGVLLSGQGGSFGLDLFDETIICALDHQPIADLDTFIEVARKIPGKRCSCLPVLPTDLY